jgi:hypothetical protein
MEQWKGRIPSLLTVVLFIFIPIPATLSHCQQVQCTGGHIPDTQEHRERGKKVAIVAVSADWEGR